MSNVQQEICPFCGKVTRTDGNFCTECGHKIEGIFNSQMANRAKINTKENERDEEVEKKRIYIVVSLLAIFVIVFIVIKLNVSSPKKVAEKYIKALMTENGDDFISVTVPKKMVGKICSKTGMTRKRIAASVEYEISDYDIDSFTIVEKTGSNSKVERYAYSMLSELDSGINITDSCVIIVEYHWDGSIEKEEIPMYKTGGRWYVLDDTVFDLIDDYE